MACQYWTAENLPAQAWGAIIEFIIKTVRKTFILLLFEFFSSALTSQSLYLKKYFFTVVISILKVKYPVVQSLHGAYRLSVASHCS